MANPPDCRCDEYAELSTLAVCALTALADLGMGYPWRELGIDLPMLQENAARLGLDLGLDSDLDLDRD